MLLFVSFDDVEVILTPYFYFSSPWKYLLLQSWPGSAVLTPFWTRKVKERSCRVLAQRRINSVPPFHAIGV
jgi:hypothetical protein